MTITPTFRGGDSSKTSETSIGVSPTSNCTPGAVVLLWVAADNAGNGGSTVLRANDVTDDEGNTWQRAGDAGPVYNPGQNNGLCGEWYYTEQDAAQITTATVITVSFSNGAGGSATVAAKAWELVEVDHDDPIEIVTWVNGSTDTSSSPDVSTLIPEADDLVLVGFGREAANSGVDDTDTTNGAWATGQGHNTSGGSGNTNIGARVQWKIPNAAGTQQWNLTGTADWVAKLLVLRETASHDRTATVDIAIALTATGEVESASHDRTASITANVDIAATGVHVAPRTADIDIAVALAADGAVERSRTASIDTNVELIATGLVEHNATASIGININLATTGVNPATPVVRRRFAGTPQYPRYTPTPNDDEEVLLVM